MGGDVTLSSPHAAVKANDSVTNKLRRETGDMVHIHCWNGWLMKSPVI
jgi:hypothetical protein